MQSLIVALALTAPSVEYSWQPGTDGQLEYIIELEDVAMQALRNGKEVSSDIHTDVVRSVKRFVIRAERPQVGRPAVTPRHAPPPGAQYGWQPGSDGQLEYYIQLNTSALDAVERGQEVSGNIHPDVVGLVKRLVLRVGDGPLPRTLGRAGTLAPGADTSSGTTILPATPPAATPPGWVDPRPNWNGWFTYGLNPSGSTAPVSGPTPGVVLGQASNGEPAAAVSGSRYATDGVWPSAATGVAPVLGQPPDAFRGGSVAGNDAPPELSSPPHRAATTPYAQPVAPRGSFPTDDARQFTAGGTGAGAARGETSPGFAAPRGLNSLTPPSTSVAAPTYSSLATPATPPPPSPQGPSPTPPPASRPASMPADAAAPPYPPTSPPPTADTASGPLVAADRASGWPPAAIGPRWPSEARTNENSPPGPYRTVAASGSGGAGNQVVPVAAVQSGGAAPVHTGPTILAENSAGTSPPPTNSSGVIPQQAGAPTAGSSGSAPRTVPYYRATETPARPEQEVEPERRGVLRAGTTRADTDYPSEVSDPQRIQPNASSASPQRAAIHILNELLLFASLGVNVVAIVIARQYYLRYCMLIREMREQPHSNIV